MAYKIRGCYTFRYPNMAISHHLTTATNWSSDHLMATYGILHSEIASDNLTRSFKLMYITTLFRRIDYLFSPIQFNTITRSAGFFCLRQQISDILYRHCFFPFFWGRFRPCYGFHQRFHDWRPFSLLLQRTIPKANCKPSRASDV